jgi:hypothetical protein
MMNKIATSLLAVASVLVVSPTDAATEKQSPKPRVLLWSPHPRVSGLDCGQRALCLSMQRHWRNLHNVVASGIVTPIVWDRSAKIVAKAARLSLNPHGRTQEGRDQLQEVIIISLRFWH